MCVNATQFHFRFVDGGYQMSDRVNGGESAKKCDLRTEHVTRSPVASERKIDGNDAASVINMPFYLSGM